MPTSRFKRPSADINVVPFVDVMLVLLVIFMITTPLLTQGIKINLPKTTVNHLPAHQKEPIIVTVDEHGLLYLNISDKPNQPITPRTLHFLVAQQLKQHAMQARPVLVRGDKQVGYGKIVDAMVILHEAGAEHIGLVTESLHRKMKG